MPNLSDLSRRDQVLKRLQDANGDWVDGADLSNAECGGSEGLKRLRELRKPEFGGHVIKMRPKPDSDQFQYRLLPKVAEVAGIPVHVDAEMPPDTFRIDRPKALDGRPMSVVDMPRHEFEPLNGHDWSFCDVCRKIPEAEGAHFLPIQRPTPPEPPERYERPTPPVQTPPEKPSVHLGRTVEGTFVVVNDTPPPVPDDEEVATPSPGQTDLGVKQAEWFKFEKMPTHLDMGSMRLCPLCKGHRKPIHELDGNGKPVKVLNPKSKKGELMLKVIGYEELTLDPRKGHSGPCERCNGFGVVPT